MTLLLIGLILAYGFVLARYIPDRLQLLANIIISLLAVAFGLANGISFSAMGLGTNVIMTGLLVTAACSLGIIVIVAAVVRLAPSRRLLTLPQVARPGKIAYQTAVRIPLSTALSEEILFRGVLLATLMQHHTTLTSVLLCSLVFGIWHIVPSLRDHTNVALIPIVGATMLAGIFFCWLRILSGSLIAPWLVHWTINASALLATNSWYKKAQHTH